jgi:hypothetical protein
VHCHHNHHHHHHHEQGQDLPEQRKLWKASIVMAPSLSHKRCGEHWIISRHMMKMVVVISLTEVCSPNCARLTSPLWIADPKLEICCLNEWEDRVSAKPWSVLQGHYKFMRISRIICIITKSDAWWSSSVRISRFIGIITKSDAWWASSDSVDSVQAKRR